ncbi:unnamed protein product [Caenorhabditis bovis]|uniref:Uncharacterized protein n=1 Tax=Caenorhabditis bovis TaxID=2654633 RepID=A0A8S1EEL7_9PELO|nr:unnamed protein product [Caenorhabditis bovis]
MDFRPLIFRSQWLGIALGILSYIRTVIFNTLVDYFEISADKKYSVGVVLTVVFWFLVFFGYNKVRGRI